MSKTVLFKTIQFSISTQFSSIWPINKIPSGATTPSQNGPGSDSNEGILGIPQSSSITGTLPSDCFVLYPGHSLGWGFHPSAEKQLVYSTVLANWASRFWSCSADYRGKLGISLSSGVGHLQNLSKSIQSSWIVSHVTKILQNFLLTQEFVCNYNLTKTARHSKIFIRAIQLTSSKLGNKVFLKTVDNSQSFSFSLYCQVKSFIHSYWDWKFLNIFQGNIYFLRLKLKSNSLILLLIIFTPKLTIFAIFQIQIVAIETNIVKRYESLHPA